MSLKAFHVVFIIASVLLAFGVGAWELNAYQQYGRRLFDLVFGLCSIAAGIALVVYGRYFLRKLRDISYL